MKVIIRTRIFQSSNVAVAVTAEAKCNVCSSEIFAYRAKYRPLCLVSIATYYGKLMTTYKEIYHSDVYIIELSHLCLLPNKYKFRFMFTYHISLLYGYGFTYLISKGLTA